jgi:hypothetical protein
LRGVWSYFAANIFSKKKYWLQNKKLRVKSEELRVKVTFLALLEKYFNKIISEPQARKFLPSLATSH